ncbi:nucleotidyltransferase family protein [Alteromonas stellipolaris]|jgi:molybdenum cofactor cytidylyltransferase|uniref:nucleotidyltransferase family protein n=1 Tax=Alteromonas stellipolaris TaxID=233316 RepID=UPI001D8186BC|nr:nucleotidyltransferase family protein [Alteromonas stellipolaris]MBZ2162925.1 nucleotidyltransferase family protein [Alteromonas stellipolaris]MDO6535270.1 nucleotidyltransferase family protein [Alteromonas stellipolaris]MDO6538002.1 nucleotidyltransferase family protein [Alteromonas stellipolaris]MDO6627146.1 nucleotidyltransferase family protein [Alteromonas stellipolaris]
MIKIASILLAGGESKRYGSNKLLSPHYSGLPLIQYALQQLQALHLDATYVVTGRWHSDIADLITANAVQDSNRVKVCYNPSWHEGIASSICCGISNAMQANDHQYTHVLVHLADLASVTTTTLQALINELPSNPNHIIFSQWYNRVLETKATVPAIFPKAAFDSLLALSGDKGAKKVIENWKNKGQAIGVNHPESAFDIDAPSDWEAYRNTDV